MNPRPSSLILEGSSDPDGLVCLQAEPPPRMVEAIADRACGILGDIRTVHRLQREALEGEIGESFRRLDRAIGLNGDREPMPVERGNEGCVHLEQRLAPGQHHVAVAVISPPLRGDRVGKLAGRRVAAAQSTIAADKIGVAELADGTRAVLFAAAPEIAPRKPAKYGRAPRM